MRMSDLKILEYDPGLAPYGEALTNRMKAYDAARERLLGGGDSLAAFANGHLYFGFHRHPDGWFYRERAPNAREIYLFGEFNGWNRHSHPMTALGDGAFELFLPGVGALPHGSLVRIRVVTEQGEELERLPLYSRRVVQNPVTLAFDAQIWRPDEPYVWRNAAFRRDGSEPLLIYECHVGMSGEKEGIATYAEFAQTILPRVRRLGYNAIQLMAVMEHPYYGSFGYQVSNFFAASSRFGTPEELMGLIDAAHGMGIAVLLDLVHSHAAKNEVEGIARFDGTVYQFFHEGQRGVHPQWGSMLFNYGKPQVLHFLLSNLKFWLEEYRFDGFRFDGVTSMLYRDHGLGVTFDNYAKYFTLNTDGEAVAYLQLAASLCKEVCPSCTLIAEDMSGMPGMCIPLAEGGIGFDYRLSMGVPDMWIRLLRDKKDDEWSMGGIWYELTQRRPREKVIGYCESHDQALVGDKTLMFRLADKEMYRHMDDASQSPPIDRAMALHKMIRLITCMNAGEGYLTFMGNEFGHPEWIDFPREGNGGSYAHARRQWSLAENGFLRYGKLEAFDRAMIALAKRDGIMGIPSFCIRQDERAKLIIFAKGDYIFLFNFHPVRDCDAAVAVKGRRCYPILNTSWDCFGGYTPRDESYLDIAGGKAALRIDRRSAVVLHVLE